MEPLSIRIPEIIEEEIAAIEMIKGGGKPGRVPMMDGVQSQPSIDIVNLLSELLQFLWHIWVSLPHLAIEHIGVAVI